MPHMKMLVTAEHPGGVMVPLSAEEEAQWELDQTSGQAASAAFATLSENRATIVATLLAGMAAANTHIANMSAATPTPAEQKAALMFSLKATKQLARLVLNLYDGIT